MKNKFYVGPVLSRKKLREERKKGNFKKPKRYDINPENELYYFQNPKKIRKFKERYSMSSYKKSKKGIFGIIAIVLVAVLLVGALGFITKGFKDWNAKDWFGKETETEEVEDEGAEVENISALNVTAENTEKWVTVFENNIGFGSSVYVYEPNMIPFTISLNDFCDSFSPTGKIKVSLNFHNKLMAIDERFFTEVELYNGVNNTLDFGTPFAMGFKLFLFEDNFLTIETYGIVQDIYISRIEIVESFVIVLNANGVELEQIVYYISEINELFIPPILERVGYHFLGWYTENDELYNSDIPVTENFTLTAEWEPIIYIVQFNSNGGNDIDNILIQHGDVLTLPIPIKTGYNFLGWYFNGDLYNNSPVESNLTLIAEWELKILTVTFNANGGTIEMTSIQVAYNNTFQLPADPIKTGYNFKGWKFNNILYSETPVTSNITLTASWEIIKLTVKFYIDDELYKTILVDYGTTLYGLRSKASEFYLNIKSVSFENSEDIGTEFIVTDNVIVVAEKQSGTQSIITTITERWYLIAGGAIILALVVALIFGKKSKKNKG